MSNITTFYICFGHAAVTWQTVYHQCFMLCCPCVYAVYFLYLCCVSPAYFMLQSFYRGVYCGASHQGHEQQLAPRLLPVWDLHRPARWRGLCQECRKVRHNLVIPVYRWGRQCELIIFGEDFTLHLHFHVMWLTLHKYSSWVGEWFSTFKLVRFMNTSTYVKENTYV